MSEMLENLKNEAAKQYTENGDINLSTTYNANLDFFGNAGTLRGQEEKIVKLFSLALIEDPKLAIENLFFLRDVRGGTGERDLFRACLAYLAEKNPEGAVKLLPFIVEYGRWDDILVLMDNKQTADATTKFIAHQLDADLEASRRKAPISLLAKWLPSINASSAKTRREALNLINKLGVPAMQYRKTLSVLRKYLNIVERNMTERAYENIDYDKVPGKAMSVHSYAFARNDRERFNTYKEALVSGEKRAKTGTLYPFEIIRQKDSELMEAQWRDMKRVTDVSGGTIVVRDGSGSMQYAYTAGAPCPADVADSLAILFSEQLTGEFKNKFITFSATPKFIDMSYCLSLADKLEVLRMHDECDNTNILAVYRLILKASLNVKPEEFIKRIVIISDMQFDEGGGFQKHTWGYHSQYDQKSTFEIAKKEYGESVNSVTGEPVPMPEIVYWNVGGRTGFPASPNENVRFVSGFSQYLIHAVIQNDGCDAMSLMTNTLAKYEDVAEAYLA